MSSFAARSTRCCWRCRSTRARSRSTALFDDPFLLAVPAREARPKPNGSRVDARDIDQQRLILLEEGHCLRDQALAFCGAARGDAPAGLGATSLSTVMQMVANGYGVTLVPKIAVESSCATSASRCCASAIPQPARSIGLAWRRTSPRKADFNALGQIVRETLAA